MKDNTYEYKPLTLYDYNEDQDELEEISFLSKKGMMIMSWFDKTSGMISIPQFPGHLFVLADSRDEAIENIKFHNEMTAVLEILDNDELTTSEKNHLLDEVTGGVPITIETCTHEDGSIEITITRVENL
jgi:hypothetical protein